MSWIGDLRGNVARFFSVVREGANKSSERSGSISGLDKQVLESRQEKKSKVVAGVPDGGKSSLRNSDFWNGAFGGIKPGFAKKDLKVLDYLANHHHDVAKAVANVVFLSSTRYTISFGSKVSSRQAERMRRFIAGRSYYQGGNRTLINDLYRQLGTYGAISAENALLMKGRMPIGVDEVVLVDNPEVDYDVIDEKFVFWQEDDKSPNNKRYLNKLTYCYLALWTDGKGPIAVPPMIAALRMLGIEDKLIEKLEAIGHKFDLFGFTTLKIEKPEQDTANDESDEDYVARLRKLLQDENEKLKNRVSDGWAVTFDENNFKIDGSKLNADNVDKLKSIIDTDKMAGLKQDGFLFGHNNSTTETLARVVLVLMIAMITSFQHLVENFLSEMFRLDLILNDFKVNEVVVTFDEPLITDQQRKENVLKLKIENAVYMWKLGIISRTELANKIGYDEPYLSDEEYEDKLVNLNPEDSSKTPKDNNLSGSDTPEPTNGTAPEKEVSAG